MHRDGQNFWLILFIQLFYAIFHCYHNARYRVLRIVTGKIKHTYGELLC